MITKQKYNINKKICTTHVIHNLYKRDTTYRVSDIAFQFLSCTFVHERN